MDIRVEIGTAVLDDCQTEICVNSFEQSWEDDAAGGDAEENQRINVIGAKDHSEVGASEGTDTMLGDDNFPIFRGDNKGESLRAALERIFDAVPRF